MQVQTQTGAGQALVIGGSLAGMVAARVLADHFEQVIIVERDRLPENVNQRKGVPQARHLHVLLLRGQQILFELFPSLETKLRQAGAVELDWINDMLIYSIAGRLPRFRSDLSGFNASRDLLEHSVRDCLRDWPQVRFLEHQDVVGLIGRGDGVAGVQVRSRDAEGGEQAIPAALTVDASGRDSHAPEWLQALGYAPPAVTTINSFYGYASVLIGLPAEVPTPWRVLMSRGAPPNTRGGALAAIEHGRWHVTLAGACRDYPPTDEAGFLAFARSLPTPEIYDLLRQGEFLTPVSGYRRMENRVRHYERLPRWPNGFVALGDAVCAFNPVYGQGMTAAAIGARVLAEHLEDARTRGIAPATVTHGFQRALARANEPAWLMATSEDFRFSMTEGGSRDRATRLAHWYLDRVLYASVEHQHVFRAFAGVTHMVDAPSALFRPAVAVRALTARRVPGAGAEDIDTLPSAEGRDAR